MFLLGALWSCFFYAPSKLFFWFEKTKERVMDKGPILFVYFFLKCLILNKRVEIYLLVLLGNLFVITH